MNKLFIIATIAGLGVAGCDMFKGNSAYDRAAPPAAQTNPVSPNSQTYSTAGNSMPGTRGGFNNDEITGKSRNPYSTTPGTGPMNSNPIASGNVPR